ncbi:MAG TPA: VOC family protein [Ktedonobacteraceae bacterium]|nr:VOC family protein [Ktedonobacteraceae bacterium]
MAALTFSHIALSCKDPIATERFYSRNFGFKRARVVQAGGDQVVFLQQGDIYLELFRASKEAPVPPAGGAGPEYPGWRHIAFRVDNVDSKLAEMGNDAKITLGPLSFDTIIPGWRSVWIADPDGNIVELSQGYRDQENPPQLQ